MKKMKGMNMKTINAIRARKQSGASLIEIVSYLGVAAIVVIGAVMLLNTAFGGANVNRAIQEISAFQTGVKRLYMGQTTGYGDGDLVPSLLAAQQVPSTVSVRGNEIFNSWNGQIRVNGLANTQFTLEYANIPQAPCIELATSRGGTGWTEVNISGTSITTFPVTVADATAACANAANTIVWTST
jgi:hypothetical protein